MEQKSFENLAEQYKSLIAERSAYVRDFSQTGLSRVILLDTLKEIEHSGQEVDMVMIHTSMADELSAWHRSDECDIIKLGVFTMLGKTWFVTNDAQLVNKNEIAFFVKEAPRYEIEFTVRRHQAGKDAEIVAQVQRPGLSPRLVDVVEQVSLAANDVRGQLCFGFPPDFGRN